jgi:Tol biopolymer transport system component
VKLRLQEIAEAPSRTDIRPVSPKSPLLLWTFAAIALVALGVAAKQSLSHPAAERALRLAFVPPLNLEFNERYPDAAVISPDGQKMAFSASTPDGKWMLYVSRLDSSEIVQVPDSDNPLEPFWSPDSRSVAFGSQGKLKRADLGAGTSILCDAARMTGGAWSPRGVIVFGSDYGSVLYQVPAIGGQPRAVTKKMEEGAHYGHTGPWFLPDGGHFLFRININAEPRGVWVGSLDSDERKQILPDNTGAIYGDGHLIFVRNQALVAQPFDASALQLKGEPLTLVKQETATHQFGGGIGRFSVSGNGILVWQGAWKTQYQLRWFDRAGRALGKLGDVIAVNSGEEPHLSPDGKQLLVKRDGNIWVLDLARGTDIRLTSRTSQLPSWMPNGKEVIYQSVAQNSAKRGIIRAPANGVAEGELVADGVKFPEDVSSDGRYVTYMMRGEKSRLDVWALQLSGEHKEYPLLDSQFDEREPRFSPDGRWLAYASDESGQPEIYVRPFTSDGKLGADKKRVSTTGGFQPLWSSNGKELFYLSADYNLMSVSVSISGESINLGAPKVLFAARTMSHYGLSHEYDVTPDGQRFLVGIAVGDSRKPAPTVLLNWQAELKK